MASLGRLRAQRLRALLFLSFASNRSHPTLDDLGLNALQATGGMLVKAVCHSVVLYKALTTASDDSRGNILG